MQEIQRYLTRFDAKRTPHILTDVLVIGTGVAGLRAALAAADSTQVLVLTKAGLKDSNTWFAQGGISAPLGRGTDSEPHLQDTLSVASGLADRRMVERLVDDGVNAIRELIEWGVPFDRTGDNLDFTLEGGHSAPRVLHSRGDAIGTAIIDTMLAKVRDHQSIRVFEHCFVIDVVTLEDRCVGAVTFHRKYGHQLIWAKQTVLASGGCGCLYRETTNPAVATGDGHALALRAGAQLQDMEMVQFHPTTLYVAGASRALISEAVRGEGGRLTDKHGERFMDAYHPQAELAPRDVVSRAILDHMIKTDATCVYLDVRQFGAGVFNSRFPGIARLCAEFEIDPSKDLVPVRPSAHYMIGGLCISCEGQSTIRGLWACGEASSSGVHGANRLASNSLLEGLVFGKAAGAAAATLAAQQRDVARPQAVHSARPESRRTQLDLDDVARSLRSLMWRNVGIKRSGERLKETLEIQQMWAKYVLDKVLDDRFGWEVQNMLTVALAVSESALYRRESRGVHYRMDYPQQDDEHWRLHVRIQRHSGGVGGLKRWAVPLDD